MLLHLPTSRSAGSGERLKGILEKNCRKKDKKAKKLVSGGRGRQMHTMSSRLFGLSSETLSRQTSKETGKDNRGIISGLAASKDSMEGGRRKQRGRDCKV